MTMPPDAYAPEDGSRWTDSHCHLTMAPTAEDLDGALDRARRAGVTRFVTIGTRPEDWGPARALARRPNLWFTAGLHPHEASRWTRDMETHLGRFFEEVPAPVAVGETGLDYHYDLSPREVQRSAFEAHVERALDASVPLVMHSRQALDDTLAILRAAGTSLRGVIHCYTYGLEALEAFLESGMYISFSGILTFPAAPELREAALRVPRDRILVETDSPYLAPVPFRGKPCEPWHTAVTGACLADLLSTSSAELARLTSRNADRLFALGES